MRFVSLVLTFGSSFFVAAFLAAAAIVRAGGTERVAARMAAPVAFAVASRVRRFEHVALAVLASLACWLLAGILRLVAQFGPALVLALAATALAVVAVALALPILVQIWRRGWPRAAVPRDAPRCIGRRRGSARSAQASKPATQGPLVQGGTDGASR